KMVCDRTFVVAITQTEANNPTIRILRRVVVPFVVFPPYQAARKQQPITPAFARSLSRKNATVLSNNQDRPARPLMPSSSRSLKFVSVVTSEAKLDETIIAPTNSLASQINSSSLR